MKSKFGFLAKLEFLQTISSSLIAALNPAMIHNLEKYYILKKVHYLSAIENVEGDYLEFGVFTGSSFCHAIRCSKKTEYLNPTVKNELVLIPLADLVNKEDMNIHFIQMKFQYRFWESREKIKKVAKDI